MAGSARLGPRPGHSRHRPRRRAFFLQRTLGWAGFLAAIVVALALMVLSFLARQDEVRWRALLPISLLVFLVWATASLIWSQYQWATVAGLIYLLAFT